MTHPKSAKPKLRWECYILAGGLSSRMGRDKAALRLDGRTLLAHVRRAARALGFPVRVVRRDLVPRCGPVGGVCTALKTTDATGVLFLSCDMPFVTAEFLAEFIRRFGVRTNAIFTAHDGRAGFPFAIRAAMLSKVERLIAENQFSIQELAKRLRAKRLKPPAKFSDALWNINTPEDWERARRISKTFEHRKNTKNTKRRQRPKSRNSKVRSS